MSLKLHSASLICGHQVWSQAYFQHNYGVILKLKSAPSSEGRHLLINQMFHGLSINGYLQFNNGTRKQLIDKLLASFQDQIETIGALHVSIDTNSVTVHTSNATVLLIRNGQAIELLDKSGQTQGKLQDGDRLALIDTPGLESMGKANFIRQLVDIDSIDELIDEIQLVQNKNKTKLEAVGLLLQITGIAKADQPIKIKLPRMKLAAVLPGITRNIHRITNFTRQLRRAKRLISRYPIKTMAFVIIAATIFLLVRWISTPSVSQDQVSTSIAMAEHKLEEGTALIELNRIRARSVLGQGEQVLTELLLKIDKNDSEYKQVEELLQKLKDAQVAATATYQVEPKLFFELSLLRDNLSADELDLIGSNLYLYSSKNQLVAKLDAQTKKSEVVAGGSWLIKASNLTGANSSLYMLTDKGVNIVGINDQTIIEKDEEWGEAVDLKYFGGNMYLLSSDGSIWKYLSAGDTFSSKKSYLLGDYKILEPQTFAIDGAIWVVSGSPSGSQILKFIGGRRDSYYVRGLEQKLGSNMKLVKTPELDNLYLLDGNRIITLGEDGLYKAQYSWKELDNILDFTVSESANTVYLLSKDTIYSFQLE